MLINYLQRCRVVCEANIWAGQKCRTGKSRSRLVFKDHLFVVDEQPFFIAGSWLFSLTSNHLNLYIRDGSVFVKMYTTKKEINTPSYLCGCRSD